MKVLITGKEGFVGQHLAEALAGHEVFGYDLRNGQNLLDYEQLRNTLDRIRPDYIYHLAAQAFVPESITNPRRAIEVNTIGSLNLLEAVRQIGIKSKILLAGTSEEYGDADNSEDNLPAPKSPYAISKLAMDLLGRWYAETYGMQVVVTRAFNHTGPGRGEMYAESAFAKQIVEIELGKREVLKHGSLDAYRNYTDVRDTVRAYQEAIDLPSDVYNICSEQNLTIGTVLNELIKLAKVEIVTATDPALIRKYDFSFKPPSCAKFQTLTGWRPEIHITQTLKDILDYHRAGVA